MMWKNLSSLLITVLSMTCCASAPTIKKTSIPEYPTSIVGEGLSKRPNGYVDLGDPEVYKFHTEAGTCTGTFINDPRGNKGVLNEHLFVTAYHCIEDVPFWSIYGYVEIAGNRVYAKSYEVAPGIDLLVVHFSYPGEIQKLDVETPLRPSNLSLLRHVGFGCPPYENIDSYGVVHSGVKRYVDFAPMYIGPVPNKLDVENLLYIVAVDFSVCPGDSGGPVISLESRKLLSIITQKWYTMNGAMLTLGVETVNVSEVFPKLKPY